MNSLLIDFSPAFRNGFQESDFKYKYRLLFRTGEILLIALFRVNFHKRKNSYDSEF